MSEPHVNQSLNNSIALQKKAWDPAHSAFVAASAGSGKTTILTNRVIRLLLENVPPGKILCLTYTKVGAAEMQSRINSELSEWAVMAEEKLAEKLFKLTGNRQNKASLDKARSLFVTVLDDADGLKISTIHSFCQSLIKQFPVEAGINPNFRIIDTVTEAELLNKAKKELLRRALKDKDLEQLITPLASKLNEADFGKILMELVKARSNLAALEEKFFDIPGIIAAIYKILDCDLSFDEKQIEQMIANPDFISSEIEFLARSLDDYGTATEKEAVIAIQNYLKNYSHKNFEKYEKVFLTNDNEPRKNLGTAKVKKSAPEALIIAQKEQLRLLNFNKKRSVFNIACATKNLLLIAQEMLSIYAALKQRHNFIDYNDLIIKSSALLQNSISSDWVKYKLDGLFEHILVDESQDSNHYQWNIVKAVSEDFFSGNSAVNKNRTIFVVGDEKQSIFSFQGANPYIFGDIFDYYQEKLSGKMENIALSGSFRSLKAVLKIVDLVFEKNPYRHAISKLKAVEHIAIREKYFGRVELWPLIQPLEKEKSKTPWELNFDESPELRAQELLAEKIAFTIKKWMNKKIIHHRDGSSRLIKYSDIMILLRKRTDDLGNFLVKHLQNLQIPVAGNDRIYLSKHIIVLDLLAAARFVLLPQDDLNLACLLKSPLFNVSEEKLLQLCLQKNREGTNLLSVLEKTQEADLQKCHQLLLDLLKIHQQFQYDFYQFFNYILEIKNGRESINKSFGKESEEIVNQFLLLCINFTEHNLPNLEKLVDALNKSDFEVKIESNYREFNEVRITTIHSAKGLEAPIVFIADAAHTQRGKRGNDQERIIWAGKKHFYLPFLALGEKNNLLDEIRNEQRALGEEEYWRLLYVAMTRAENELYITGFGKEKNIQEDCWYNVIKQAISGVGEITEEGNWVYAKTLEEQNNEEILVASKNEKTTIIIPDFLQKPVVVEYSPQIIQPSSLENQGLSNNEKKFAEKNSFNDKVNLGQIIHKILEIFPTKISDETTKHNLISKFLRHNYELDQESETKIIRQVLNIITHPELSDLLSGNVRKEVPIIGKINGQNISGKIDLCVFRDEEIIVIDYKTGIIITDLHNETLRSYHQQLQLYQQLVAEIYFPKKVRAAILWTELPKLEFINSLPF